MFNSKNHYTFNATIKERRNNNMTIDCGYGAKIDNPQWKEDAYSTLLSMLGPNMKSVFESYHNESKEEGYSESQEEYMKFFCDEYENSVYGWTGIFGFIADIINENEFDGNVVFRADFNDFNDFYDVLYVSADIPEDEDERSKMITKKHIREIIAKYLSPTLESGLNFDYITINEKEW